MDDRRWNEAEVLMADLKSHRHAMLGASEEEVERRMRGQYQSAVAPPVRDEGGAKTEAQRVSAPRTRRKEDKT